MTNRTYGINRLPNSEGKSQVKKQLTEWETVFVKYTPDTELISGAFKVLKNPSQEIK